MERHITNFRNGGWLPDQDLFFSDGDLLVLPRAGDYEIMLRSKKDGATFVARGALVTLERWEDIGSALWWALAVIIGYCCLGAAAIVAIVLAAKRGA
jgi:hypothetical protein